MSSFRDAPLGADPESRSRVRCVWIPGSREKARPGMTESHIHLGRPDIGDAQHVGGAGGAERHAGDDDDALPGFGKAVAKRDAVGAVDHIVLVVRILRDHAMYAPYQG